jgi:DNA-binding transcriptional MerR regulator
MDEDGGTLLTIGQLARRTGLPVRTIRYWSDIGAAPPAGRSGGRHRLYDAEAVTRLSATERAQIIDDFIADVFDGLDPSPTLKDKLRFTTPELPTEPTSDQVAAWVELAELV